jgi:ketosteroid isomerase-like protein
MSQENVELILRIQLGPDVDGVPVVRSDEMWATLADAVAPFLHPDFETEARTVGENARDYGPGMDGFRAFWLDWLEPWESYRVEIERSIDCGDQVVILVRDLARREGSTAEVQGRNGSVWTFQDGKIRRFSGYVNQADALEAVGLRA